MPKEELIAEFEKDFSPQIMDETVCGECTTDFVALKSFILKAFEAGEQTERERMDKVIKERIEIADIMIQSAEKGDDLEDGWTPEERINHEESAKAVLESLLVTK